MAQQSTYDKEQIDARFVLGGPGARGLSFFILPQKRPRYAAEIFPGKSFYCIIVIYEARGIRG